MALRKIKFPRFEFVKHRKVTYIISLSLIVIGLISIIARGGLNYGIDFTGGINLQVHFDKQVHIEDIRKVAMEAGYKNSIIQKYGTANDYLIKFQGNIEQEKDTLGPEIVKFNSYPNPSNGEKTVALRITAYDSQSPIKNMFIRADFMSEVQPISSDDVYDKIEENGKFDVSVEQFSKDTILTVYVFAVDYANNKGPEKAIQIAVTLKDSKAIPEIIASWEKENYIADEQEAIFSPTTKIVQLLKDNFKDANIRIDMEEIVGPSISKELQTKSLWVILVGLLGILIYVWIRFTFRFGVAAIIALFHDVIITVGIFSIMNKEISIPIVAAILTLIGYSINDSIVISDRIRENMKLMRKSTLGEIITTSLNQVLSRTIITSLTTLIVLLCLYFIGGPVIHDFSLALIIGVIIGTYSSIYVVAQLVFDWERMYPTKKGR